MTHFEVIHRDDRIIAINKPSGMAVHRGWSNDPTTVADLVRDGIVGAPVFAVHRLDRGTSGVLLFALDADAARFFQKQMEQGEFKKRYVALVRGPMREACLLDHPVPKAPGEERVPAVTAFKPLQHAGRWSLVEAAPITGRLHQIRRHLKHLSHPIVGDVKYGKGDINRLFRERYQLHRLALHATELQVWHPDGNPIILGAALPPDLVQTLHSLGLNY